MNIKEIRKQLHLSQKQFADRLQISLRTLQGWEAGRPIPEAIQNMINRIIWLEELSKEQLSAGDYETMNTTIEKKEFNKENFNNLMNTLFPGVQEKYNALSEEEKEILDLQNQCDILNEDLAEELGELFEFRPAYFPDEGYKIVKCAKRID